MMQIDMILSQVTGSAAPGVVPTTWNPLDKGAGVSLSNGDLTASTSGNSSINSATLVRSIASVQASTINGLYWEVRCNDDTTGEAFGIATSSWGGLYSAEGFWGIRRTAANPIIYKCGSGTPEGVEVARVASQIGDVYMFALKNGCLHAGVNGTWTNSSDPVANINALWSGITGTVFVAVTDHSNAANLDVTANFGASSFAYPVPVGYSAGFGVLL
jgi:hypothetical protein